MPDYVHDEVPRLLMFIDMLSMFRFYLRAFLHRYFVPLALAVGEGDAAGEGLAAGLDFTAGVVSVAPLGDADVDGDGLAPFGEFELLAGSQPAAKTIESIAGSRSAVRPMVVIFEVRINFLPRFKKIEKRGDNCPCAN